MNWVPNDNTAPGRLLWRCRRGMKELDVLLQRWLRDCYAGASAPERDDFDAFLDLPDPELVRYLVRGETPEQPRFARIAGQIGHAGR